MNNTTNTNTKVYMKAWFYEKNGYGEYGPYCEHACFVRKETEKAYQVEVIVKNFSFTCWIPKSCTLATLAEMVDDAIANEQRKAEWEARRQERFEAACKAYADLIAYAKANGVRGVREGLRRETIEQKILNAGLPLPA